MKEGAEEYGEKIAVNKEKQTETIHVDAHGQSEEADIINDFKRVSVSVSVPLSLHSVISLVASKYTDLMQKITAAN